jgi:hypothetical protein
MAAVIRVVLLLLLAALLVGALIGIFATTTGFLEKIAFAVAICLILALSGRVHRIGSRSAS